MIWSVFILILPIIAAIISLWKKTNRFYWRKNDTLLWLIVSITLIEGLVIMNFLTLSPYMQSFILMIIPLTAIEIYSDWRENKLNGTRVFRYCLAVGLALIVIFFSAPQGYQ